VASRDSANTWAAWAAVVTLLFGLIVVVVPTLANLDTILAADPFVPRETTTRVVESGPQGETTTTTTQEADDSLVERLFSSGGLLILRLGLVAAAAFLAGAVVQRTLLGEFAIKIGPVDVPQLKDVAKAADDLGRDVVGRISALSDATQQALDASALIAERLDDLERRISEGDSETSVR
jgi:hypothetical protein